MKNILHKNNYTVRGTQKLETKPVEEAFHYMLCRSDSDEHKSPKNCSVLQSGPKVFEQFFLHEHVGGKYFNPLRYCSNERLLLIYRHDCEKFFKCKCGKKT